MAELLLPDGVLAALGGGGVGADDGSLHPLGPPVAVGGAPDAVAERLVTAIALGIYSPGQQLPAERELATALGVSRTTAREGLGRLVADGYLEVRRGRFGGYFLLAQWGPGSAEMVRRSIIPNWQQFEALFDARRLIEGLIAATAAVRRTDADVAALRAAAADYRAAGDRAAGREADGRLHRAVASATGNAVLVDLSQQMRARVTLNLGGEPYTDAVRLAAIGQHDDLVAAIAAADASAASAIASAHFMLTEQLIRDLVARVRAGELA